MVVGMNTKPKHQKPSERIRQYLRDKFQGILARQKWDEDDVDDVFDYLIDRERNHYKAKNYTLSPEGALVLETIKMAEFDEKRKKKKRRLP